MNSSVKGYHRKPTYDELIQEAVINPTEKIKYPNRIATQLRNTAQLTRFDDESFLEMSTINSNAMKQTMQQTAVQRALQPVTFTIPTGITQFDMADGEEETNLQEQEGEARSMTSWKRGMLQRKRARLQTVAEDALAVPDQIDDMMRPSSAGAASSGDGSSTALVDVRATTQVFEDLTGHNLRGSLGRFGHRRTDSSGSTASAVSAASAASAASTVAMPTQIKPKAIDIDTLIAICNERKTVLNQQNTVDDSQLAMEITTNIVSINRLRSNEKYRTNAGGKAYVKAKKRLIEIMDMPL